VRVFKFLDEMPTILSNILKTVELFAPFLTMKIPDYYNNLNVQFLKEYAKMDV